MATARCHYCECRMNTKVMKQSGNMWECRSDTPCFNRLLAKFREAQSVGNQMSNACFNVSQNPALSAADRTSLAALYGRWDQMKKMGEAK